MSKLIQFLTIIPLMVAGVTVHAEPRAVLGHVLDIRIDPEQGTFAANDRLELPDGVESWEFSLHSGLNPVVATGTATLRRVGVSDHLEHFWLRIGGSTPVSLSYAGRIHHGLEEIREGMGRARQGSRGIISKEGVVLDGFSGWYPRNQESLQRFDLQVRLPKGWLAVSQGVGPKVAEDEDGVSVQWREEQPQDDIYLIAAPFVSYARDTPQGEAQVYLRRPDPELAASYLAATERYLGLYSALIGPYPYAKFALVENFWETGFGMPSFTLLGPKVIRLPFIVHTSYPHEVLHNWWGNGVYVDYRTGNWSEGLTAYLADHLLKEQRGQGADYRRDALRAYADYVRAANDFPLRDFRGRHGSASQAIGYGKTLMMLHMLRRMLGDETFIAALRRFYREQLFQAAGFDDLRQAMEEESGRDLRAFYRHWTERRGSPELALTGIRVERTGDAHVLHGRLEQVQPEAPFPLQVPLVVHLEGGDSEEHLVPIDDRSADFELELSAAPVRVDADPRFDLFRALVPGESPVTSSALFGSETGLILLPEDAPAELQAGYRRLAETWREGAPGWEVVIDSDVDALPDDLPVWLLGWRNRFLGELTADEAPFRLDVERRSVELPDGDFTGEDLSLVLVRDRAGRSLGWIAPATAKALPGLARKLPRYGKYSYLLFRGQAPINRVKGRWPVRGSRLMVWLSERRPELLIPPRRPLTAVLD